MISFIVSVWVYGIVLSLNPLASFFEYLKQQEFEKARASLAALDNRRQEHLLAYLSDLLYYGGQQPLNKIRLEPENDFEQAILHLTNGYYELYYTTDKSDAFKNFHEALEIARMLKHVPLIKASLLAIFEFYHSSIVQNSAQFEIYLTEYRALKPDATDRIIIGLYTLIFLSQTADNPDVEYFKHTGYLDSYLRQINIKSRLNPRIYYEKALSLELNKSMDSAIYYYNLAYREARDYPFLQYMRFSSKIKLSDIAYQKGNYREALDLIRDARHNFDRSDSTRSNLFLNRYAAFYYAGLEQYDSAYFHFKQSSEAEYKLDFRNNTLEINRLNVVLQTQQKELENSRLRQNKIWLIVASSILGLFLMLSYLTLQNIRTKKRIVEKEKEIQTQKVEKLIREQELSGIDAMIEGQEKERQRLANELHDHLGSLLATVKYHLQNIRIHRQQWGGGEDALLDKTDDLLEQAYQKVRGIAHERNAGVPANEGLLPAVKNFASKVSHNNRLQIEVIDYGMDRRLENSLELALFRIIQELITNIIKHSGGREASVHLTHHETSINVLVEDDGSGFESSSAPVGMGLYAIRKRIETLAGKLTIDSVLGKGTTVIIDIPL
jgi:signal transduction histidine kinase